MFKKHLTPLVFVDAYQFYNSFYYYGILFWYTVLVGNFNMTSTVAIMTMTIHCNFFSDFYSRAIFDFP